MIAGTAAVCIAAVLLFPIQAHAISAKRAICVDALSGRVLFSRDADKQSLIASTTKIMTALVICEQCNVLDRMRIPKEAVGIEGSSMYLQEGEILTIQELLYGLMLSSGNDAAVALAIYCGGTVEGFVQMMNDKARLLNLTQTHFENPNGLDSPEHYSTAGDLAVLAAYAMENPIFRQTVSTKSVACGDRFLRNHNKLLWQVPGADGVKTGYTRAAGRILVSSATRNGRRVIAVTIDAPDDWRDHAKLLEDGFSLFNDQRIITEGDLVGRVRVVSGQNECVEIRSAQHFTYPIAQGEDVRIVIPGVSFVYAPVTEGADAGFAHVFLSGRKIGEIRIVFGQTVEMEQPKKKSLFEKIFGGEAYAGTTAENSFCQRAVLPAEG